MLQFIKCALAHSTCSALTSCVCIHDEDGVFAPGVPPACCSPVPTSPVCCSVPLPTLAVPHSLLGMAWTPVVCHVLAPWGLLLKTPRSL